MRISLTEDVTEGCTFVVEYRRYGETDELRDWLRTERPDLYQWRKLAIKKNIAVGNGRMITVLLVKLYFPDKADAALFKLFWQDLFTS